MVRLVVDNIKRLLDNLKISYLISKANSRFYQGKYEEVVCLHEKLRAIAPDYSDAYSHLGRSYVALNRYKDASEVLSSAYENFRKRSPIPENYLEMQELVDIFIAYSDALRKLGRSDQAEMVIGEAREWSQRVGESLTQTGRKKDATLKTLGQISYKLEAPKRTIKYLEAVINRYSKDSLVNCYLGMSYMDIGAYDKALPYLIRAEELSLKDDRLYEGIAYCLFKTSQFEKSMAWYRKALSINPDSPKLRNNTATAYVNLADKLLEEGQEKEAIGQFRLALEVEPDDSIVETISQKLTELGDKTPIQRLH